MSRGERKAMIRRDHPDLSLSRQCRLLTISRSSFYYAAKGESPKGLALMRRIDELFLKYPFYGSRQMVRQLRREGVRVFRFLIMPPISCLADPVVAHPDLSLSRQCRVLTISRSSFYYSAKGESSKNLALMRARRGHLRGATGGPSGGSCRTDT